MKRQGIIPLLAIVIFLSSLACSLFPENSNQVAYLSTVSKTLTPTSYSTEIDATATPTAPNEVYSHFPPLDPKSDQYWPPALTPLMKVPELDIAWPVTATATAKNGLWGIVDPKLARKKYLVLAQAAGYTVEPAGLKSWFLAVESLIFKVR